MLLHLTGNNTCMLICARNVKPVVPLTFNMLPPNFTRRPLQSNMNALTLSSNSFHFLFSDNFLLGTIYQDDLDPTYMQLLTC